MSANREDAMTLMEQALARGAANQFKPEMAAANLEDVAEDVILAEFDALGAAFVEAMDAFLNASQLLAFREHGKDMLESAMAWGEQTPGGLSRFITTAHPYDALMQAYKASQAN